ncbi:hypothetical protein QLL95_gp0998 [Cotonvirus japonicus]|uniref:Uncharacterized protein n=1 Tax=Cotonvirus japonicus TaxID=2811091 RepID=A0ABM7NSI1_9VIRU|nr:hypothetical protein QLL95_gp0998 [Cotonvirus japonicus]BCS83125.1 hypothetical protein [Cotonvirus japonicus]
MDIQLSSRQKLFQLDVKRYSTQSKYDNIRQKISNYRVSEALLESKIKTLQKTIKDYDNNTNLHHKHEMYMNLYDNKIYVDPINRQMIQQEFGNVCEEYYRGFDMKKELEEIQSKLFTVIKMKNDISVYQECTNYKLELRKLSIEIVELEKIIEQEELEVSNSVIKQLGKLELFDEEYVRKCVEVLRVGNLWDDYLWDEFLWNKTPEAHEAIMSSYRSEPKLIFSKLICMTEREIVTKAHQMYNDFLVKKNGPYDFCHVGKNKPCKWDGVSRQCACSKKCFYWNDEHVDWIKDMTLKSVYPVGKLECTCDDWFTLW